jgi:hypothetical protein
MRGPAALLSNIAVGRLADAKAKEFQIMLELLSVLEPVALYCLAGMPSSKKKSCEILD